MPAAVMQDMHVLAERHILEGLKAGGWLQGDVQDMLDQRICALFMPHGQDSTLCAECVQVEYLLDLHVCALLVEPYHRLPNRAYGSSCVVHADASWSGLHNLLAAVRFGPSVPLALTHTDLANRPSEPQTLPHNLS